MKTMTFQARELKDALVQVRSKLGPDALILSTREVMPLLGLGRPLLEVTVALPDATGGTAADLVGAAARRVGPVSRLFNRVPSGGSAEASAARGPGLQAGPAGRPGAESAGRSFLSSEASDS